LEGEANQNIDPKVEVYRANEPIPLVPLYDFSYNKEKREIYIFSEKVVVINHVYFPSFQSNQSNSDFPYSDYNHSPEVDSMIQRNHHLFVR
jgi:hypothetical protein